MQSHKRKPPKSQRETTRYAKKLKAADAVPNGKDKSDWVKAVPPSEDAEFEFDSDPIEESATPDSSGDGSGVSWPSDGENDEAGGVALPVSVTSSKKAPGKPLETPAKPPKATAVKPTLNGNRESNGSRATNGTQENGPAKQPPTESAHAKQRLLAKERRAGKANADEIARAKKIWEKLRMGALKAAERKALIEELFDVINGRVKDFVLKHDAGRVIQTALKYGNKSQRRTIAEELTGEYRQLATGKYAKFTIGKLLSFGDDSVRDIVIPEFYGHVRNLIKHPEAGWILDDIYRGAATATQKAKLLREWYGAEFSMFQSSHNVPDTADLQSILAAAPEKRGPVMRYLFEMIQLLVQKRTTGFTMLHDAMLQYYLNLESGSSAMTELTNMVADEEEGDLLRNLAFTASGSRLISLLLARGSAKERKLLLRSYKGHVRTLAFDKNGYKVLVTAIEVVDDTVLLAKLIYSELVPTTGDGSDEQILEALQHLTARIPLLLPYTRKSASLLVRHDTPLFDEIHAIRETTSKKDPTVRSTELIKATSPALLGLIARNTFTLLQSSYGCQCIQEVLLSSSSETSERQAAIDALLALINPSQRPESTPEGDEAALIEATLDAPASTRMLKTLVYSGHFNPATGQVEACAAPLGFAGKLYELLFKGKQGRPELLRWATGLRSFVIEAMLRSDDMPPQDKTELLAALKACVKELKAAVKAGDELGKHGVEAKPKTKPDHNQNQGGGAVDKSKESANAAVRVGAKGAQALLELLG